MSPIGVIGFGALGLLVLGWFVVSFSAPGPRRSVIEWLSATMMYVALLALFVNLVLRALAADNTFALVAFGFLCAFFSAGLVVSVFNTGLSLRGGRKQQASATN